MIYGKIYKTPDYSLDYDRGKIMINQTGEWVDSTREVLDFIRRESYRQSYRDKKTRNNELSWEMTIPGTDIPIKNTFIDEKSINPGAWIDSKIDMENVDVLLHGLSEKERSILYDIAVNGISQTEMGKKFGLTKATINYWKKKASEKIIQAYGDVEMER